MSISNAYTNWSSTYDSDRNLTRDLDQIVTTQILSPHRYKHILELGCGTGKNTDLLVQIGVKVDSLDFSEGMIAQAKAKVPSDNVTFTVADLTQRWFLADNTVDLAVCNLVLEHIEDLNHIFAEAHRVLQHGGHFFLCELHPFKQYQGKKAVFQQDDQQVEIAAFVHHLSNFTDAAQAAGFKLISLNEWWHGEDEALKPRLVSFMFQK